MANRSRRRHPDGSDAEHPQTERVTFDDDDFNSFLVELHRRYPYEWIALAMGGTDLATGLTQGEILAHGNSHAHVADCARAHLGAHPEIDVRLFTTAMGRL